MSLNGMTIGQSFSNNADNQRVLTVDGLTRRAKPDFSICFLKSMSICVHLRFISLSRVMLPDPISHSGLNHLFEQCPHETRADGKTLFRPSAFCILYHQASVIVTDALKNEPLTKMTSQTASSTSAQVVINHRLPS